jgi:hypothetical protein
MGSYSSTSYGLLLTEEFGSKLKHIPKDLFELARAVEMYDYYGGRLAGLPDEEREEFEDRRAGGCLDEGDDELMERWDAGSLSKEVREAFTYVGTADGPAFVLGFYVSTKDLTKPEKLAQFRPRWDKIVEAFPAELQVLIQQGVKGSEDDPAIHVLTGKD